jgi:hydrogenase expression/formation protein HypC
MCLAIPMKLLARQGDKGTTDLDGVHTEVSLILCPEAQMGDWLIVHAGFALTVMDEAAAAETLQLLSELSGDER